MRTILTFAALLSLTALVGCDATPPATPTRPATPAPGTVANPATPAPGTVAKPAPTDTANDANLDADNTGINKRDRDLEAAKTPIDQDEDQGDVNITAEIRKRVVAEKGILSDAGNVKVITADGKVTLRGPVASAADRDSIGKIAADVAGGADKVDNQLEVDEK